MLPSIQKNWKILLVSKISGSSQIPVLRCQINFLELLYFRELLNLLNVSARNAIYRHCYTFQVHAAKIKLKFGSEILPSKYFQKYKVVLTWIHTLKDKC